MRNKLLVDVPNNALRVLAVVTGTGLSSWWTTTSTGSTCSLGEEQRDTGVTSKSSQPAGLSISKLANSSPSRRSGNATLTTTPYPLATFAASPHTNSISEDTGYAQDDPTSTPAGKPEPVEYDFVVVGNGNAGHAAVETLQKQCPGATIALVDPLRPPPKSSSKILDYYATFVASLDPHNHIVQLLQVVEDDTHHTNTTRIRYRHAILLATGNHGAPAPSYLIDPHAQHKILELRPTFRPVAAAQSDSIQQRPFLPALEVRQRAVKAASRGETVGVVGSGWDAIDLAVTASSAAACQRSPTAATPTSTSSSSSPWMIYGRGGPVSHILPNYLSSAVAKRLRSKKAAVGRIHTLDRTLIRYINLEEDAVVRHNDKFIKKSRIQLYTAKAHDFLDTQRINVDLLVITGDGNAVLPTEDIPTSLCGSGSIDGRTWYKAWSQLTYDDDNDDGGTSRRGERSNDNLLLCYKDDGRIVVNPELAACSGVFAAGSVAKCGNSLTGHANVAGVGAVDGPASGRVAATNMSRSYNDSNNNSRGLFGRQRSQEKQHQASSYRVASKDPVPVWRSDLLSYDMNGTKPTTSSLASVGIHALCVGHCDSERFSTHGVWWTNLAAQRRLMASQEPQPQQQQQQDDSQHQNGQDGKIKGRRRRPLSRKAGQPIYGMGVVYYMDRTGKIQGVMTWGLPFSNSDSQLNDRLVQQMKQIVVKSNMGTGFTTSPSAPFVLGSESHMRMSNELTLKSRRLLATAFSSLRDVEDFPKPLHRFTEVRPPRVRSMGMLKRNDDGHGQGVLGEDMFYGQSGQDEDEEEDPSVVPMKPVVGVGFASPVEPTAGVAQEAAENDDNTSSNNKSSLYTQRRNSIRTKNVSYQTIQNMHNFYLHEHREKQFEDNEALARPPKEEPLWIRKGDERRATNAAESRSAALRAAFTGSS